MGNFMGNFISNPLTKPYFDAFQAATTKKAPKQNSTPTSTGAAVPAPGADIAQTTTEGDLSVNRKKRRGKASLIIDSTNLTNTGTGGSGLNV